MQAEIAVTAVKPTLPNQPGETTVILRMLFDAGKNLQ